MAPPARPVRADGGAPSLAWRANAEDDGPVCAARRTLARRACRASRTPTCGGTVPGARAPSLWRRNDASHRRRAPWGARVRGALRRTRLERAFGVLQWTSKRRCRLGDAPLILCSARAGGRGISLVAATHPVFFEPAPTAVAYEQCRHRPLRWTRPLDRSLEIILLVAAESIEEGHFVACWARASVARLLDSGTASAFDPDADYRGQRWGQRRRDLDAAAVRQVSRVSRRRICRLCGHQRGGQRHGGRHGGRRRGGRWREGTLGVVLSTLTVCDVSDGPTVRHQRVIELRPKPKAKWTECRNRARQPASVTSDQSKFSFFNNPPPSPFQPQHATH